MHVEMQTAPADNAAAGTVSGLKSEMSIPPQHHGWQDSWPPVSVDLYQAQGVALPSPSAHYQWVHASLLENCRSVPAQTYLILWTNFALNGARLVKFGFWGENLVFENLKMERMGILCCCWVLKYRNVT